MTRLQSCSLCAFVLGLSKQSYLHFSTIMLTPYFHRSDNILTAVSVWHFDLTIPYWHELWPHNSHETSGFLFLLTLFEPSIEGKATVDTAMHNWSSLSYNTTNQPFKCLSMIRQREGTQKGSRTKTGRSQVNESVESWWKWRVKNIKPSTTRGQ